MAKDILMDETGDLLIEGGDLVVGDSAQQHIQDILLSDKGQWIESPEIGVAIIKQLKGSISLLERIKLERKIRLHLTSDKAKGVKISIDELGKIQVTARYE